MSPEEIRTAEEALSYMVGCTLATVEDMAMKKSRSKSEYERQILIAQRGVDWMREMGVDTSDTRYGELKGLSVQQWADKFDVKNK